MVQGVRQEEASLEVLIVCKIAGQEEGLLSCLLHSPLCHLRTGHDQEANNAATNTSLLFSLTA